MKRIILVFIFLSLTLFTFEACAQNTLVGSAWQEQPNFNSEKSLNLLKFNDNGECEIYWLSPCYNSNTFSSSTYRYAVTENSLTLTGPENAPSNYKLKWISNSKFLLMDNERTRTFVLFNTDEDLFTKKVTVRMIGLDISYMKKIPEIFTPILNESMYPIFGKAFDLDKKFEGFEVDRITFKSDWSFEREYQLKNSRSTHTELGTYAIEDNVLILNYSSPMTLVRKLNIEWESPYKLLLTPIPPNKAANKKPPTLKYTRMY